MGTQVRNNDPESGRKLIGNGLEEIARRGPAMNQQQDGPGTKITIAHHGTVAHATGSQRRLRARGAI